MGKYLEWSLQYRSQVDAVVADVSERPKIINDMPMLIRLWEPGTIANPIEHVLGEVRSEDGIPYKCCQAHTHSGEIEWNPSSAPALWTQYHGTSQATARPFIHPTGAHDVYMSTEYMIWTDGEIYHSTIDNNAYSPTEHPQGWERWII